MHGSGASLLEKYLYVGNSKLTFNKYLEYHEY